MLESSVPDHKQKRINHPWPWNGTINRLHTLPMDNPTKDYSTNKCACSPTGYNDKATNIKETGRMGQDLRHPNMQLLGGVVCISGRNLTFPSPKSTKYILKEYNDIFGGIGTFPGDEYQIKLKKEYKPVQHPPRSALAKQSN